MCACASVCGVGTRCVRVGVCVCVEELCSVGVWKELERVCVCVHQCVTNVSVCVWERVWRDGTSVCVVWEESVCVGVSVCGRSWNKCWNECVCVCVCVGECVSWRSVCVGSRNE